MNYSNKNKENTMDMQKFRKVDGTMIPDVAEYIMNYINAYDGDVQLYIGTDSQSTRKKRVTNYATVICMHRTNSDGIGKGAHLIYNRERKTNVKDLFTRLWWEVEYSMQVANYLRDKNVYLNEKVLAVHIDVSPDKKNKSNSVYASAVGYVESMGYECCTKPDSPVASYAADMVVRM